MRIDGLKSTDKQATGRGLIEKIDSLAAQGVPAEIVTDLHEARLLGNWSLHDGLAFSADEVADVALLIEEAVTVVYVQPEERAAMRAARKARCDRNRDAQKNSGAQKNHKEAGLLGGRAGLLRAPLPFRSADPPRWSGYGAGGHGGGRTGQSVTAEPVRRRGDVLGFGLAVALFLPGVAYLGITNGHQFIANDFFAFMYCLACVGFASVPLMAWRRGGGRYANPGFVRSAWFPWLFTTGQGVAYSSARGDANVFVLIVGWGAFVYAGMVALYFLARALWAVDDDQAVPPVGEDTAKPEPSA